MPLIARKHTFTRWYVLAFFLPSQDNQGRVWYQNIEQKMSKGDEWAEHTRFDRSVPEAHVIAHLLKPTDWMTP